MKDKIMSLYQIIDNFNEDTTEYISRHKRYVDSKFILSENYGFFRDLRNTKFNYNTKFSNKYKELVAEGYLGEISDSNMRKLISRNNNSIDGKGKGRFEVILSAYIILDCIRDEMNSNETVTFGTAENTVSIKLDDWVSVTNYLLKSIGYPVLRSTNEREACHIYALGKNMTYKESCDFYNRYMLYKSSLKESDTQTKDNSTQEHTSTYFNNEILKLTKEEIDEQILFEKIHTLISKAETNISTFIHNIFVKTVKSLCKEENRNCCPERLFMDFYFYFFDIDKYFLKHLSEEYKKNYKLTKDLEEEINTMVDDALIYNSEYHQPNPIFKSKIYTIVNNLYAFYNLEIDKDKKILISREMMILWLIYCGYSKSEIDATISHRYIGLDANVFFDKYAITISDFIVRKKCIYKCDKLVEDATQVMEFTGDDIRDTLLLRRFMISSLDFPEEYTMNSILSKSNEINL